MHLSKVLMFTDLHVGRRNNSEQHNEDCVAYIDWMIAKAKKTKAQAIVFLGDFFQQRSSVAIETLTYSMQIIRKLNDIGIPVFMIVGNHDLRYRNTRELFSTIMFEEFENVTVVSDPYVEKTLGPNGTLLAPFLFHDEYDIVQALDKVPVWMGHFEFKDFILTGSYVKNPSGPDGNKFGKPKKIFSGHFHKRQSNKNIHYIGNTFPMDYSDANDFERGCALYEYDTDTVTYFDWTECPKYIRCTVSELVNPLFALADNKTRIECLIDEQLTFEEINVIRAMAMDKFNLRELTFNDREFRKQGLQTVDAEDETSDTDSIDDMVLKMFANLEVPNVDSELLVQLYRNAIRD